MARFAALGLFGCMFLLPLNAEEPDSPSLGDRVARWINPTIRQADRRLTTIEEQLRALPELYSGPRGSRFGFLSETIESQDQPHWLQIDLSEVQTIDSIVLVPIVVPTRGREGEGYAFPIRFRIEVSSEESMEDARVVADHTMTDFANPRRYPVQFALSSVEARFVRVTSTKHVPRGEGFVWGLEEFMIMSGNRNVAVSRPKAASSHEELFPNWSVHRVNDGISRLGYPCSIDPSPTSGYLSAPSEQSTETKWIVVDFGEPVELDEVRIIPTTSEEKEVIGGRGFPERIKVELSNDPEFQTTSWQAPGARNPLGYPWKSPFVRPCSGGPARYLRVSTLALFARGNLHSFALAEIQAYRDDTNIALGKPVTASDITTRLDAKSWSPQFVVDGYSSTHRLSELPEFLDQIMERRDLEREHTQLLRAREERIEITFAAATAGVGSVGAIAVFGWIWMAVRQRGVRRRDAEKLRAQIARDLHDDIGSNLAGIVLISEVGSRNPETTQEARDDFREIKETAEHTSDAMRDIVWLIHVGKATTRDLLIKMRESVELILGDLETSIVAEPPEFKSRQIDLQVRRHFFFAFKESLTNVRRHAQATVVKVRFHVMPNAIRFEVSDNGTGFDPDTVEGPGSGLENLQRRAERVNGSCIIDSIPQRGTCITFTAPFNRKRL